MDKRKIIFNLIVLASVMASMVLAFTLLFGKNIQASHAQSPGVTVTDFWLNGGQEPWGVTFDSKGKVWVAVPGCDPSPTCGSSTPPGKIEEYNPATSSWINTYQLPAGFGQPLFLAFDSSGNGWFAMPMSNSIGMLNPQTNAYQQFAVPTAASGPWDLAIDHNGNIWFTEHYTNNIGEFNPSTQQMTEFTTPAANSQPYGIVVDGSDNIWFTENNSAVAQIGEYTADGQMKEYKIRNNPPGGLTPHMLTVEPDGNVWWTEGWVGMIGELKVSQATPGTTNGVTEYSYPPTCTTCSGTHTSGISFDSNGLIWFDDSIQGIFGSFPDSGTGSFAMYNAPTPQHPHDGLNVDSQNRIWFTEEFANKLAEAIQNNVQPPPTPTFSPSPTITPPPGTTLAQDTFQRTNQKHWGNASDGLTWAGEANSASAFSIVNNAGQLSNSGGAFYAQLGPVSTDSEVIFSGSLNVYKLTNLGAVLRWKDSNNWYKAFINGARLVVQKKVNGTITILKSVPFVATAGQSYSIDFSIVGAALSANVWLTSTTEPSGWMVKATDSSLSSGFCGIQIQMHKGAIATITSFQVLS